MYKIALFCVLVLALFVAIKAEENHACDICHEIRDDLLQCEHDTLDKKELLLHCFDTYPGRELSEKRKFCIDWIQENRENIKEAHTNQDVDMCEKFC
eukprot:TRINITY_DN61597_c0_g1_i1.p1 TRINITY_DN61597_c0_g1~~TRINITY_DN61597_c0_g1_i1.p1  ORF type:complete len:97 (-),score=18.38 TRINITY_DN61597_c0_g1_i1:184-474(-)